MAVFSRQGLLTELLDRTELIKASTQPFFRLTNEQLNFKPTPATWSIAEIFGHLSITNDLYIRSIVPKITRAPDTGNDQYKSGWLGDLIYDRIMPREDGSVFKLKAFKSHCAGKETLDGQEILDSFLHKCDAIDDILRHVTAKDLQRIRIPFAFNRLFSLRLGDNLRFLVAHCERHLLQAQRVIVILQ
jgi:hypothetical protein